MSDKGSFGDSGSVESIKRFKGNCKLDSDNTYSLSPLDLLCWQEMGRIPLQRCCASARAYLLEPGTLERPMSGRQ